MTNIQAEIIRKQIDVPHRTFYTALEDKPSEYSIKNTLRLLKEMPSAIMRWDAIQFALHTPLNKVPLYVNAKDPTIQKISKIRLLLGA